ncbi:putative tetratricopeptide-like helical domain superfamily [Helianthus debilis subsp. tardiflorus]
MKHDYSIEPTMKHDAVIVDLYGRAGRLNQALRFIKNMPIDPDFVIWGALFSACRTHKNIQMTEYASEKLLELEPKHPGGYVFLSNVYAGAGKCQVTSFVAGDHFHDRSDEIHLKLDEITKNARELATRLKLSGCFIILKKKKKKKRKNLWEVIVRNWHSLLP